MKKTAPDGAVSGMPAIRETGPGKNLQAITVSTLRTAVNDFMDCVHHIWCPLFSQEFQDLPDGAETTLTYNLSDGAMEDALYEIASMRLFARLSLDSALPDRTTIDGGFQVLQLCFRDAGHNGNSCKNLSIDLG